MASITPLGDGRYRVRWFDGGKRTDPEKSKTCSSPRAARQLKKEIEEAHSLGRRWEPPARVELPLFKDLIDAYLKSICRISAQATIDSNRSQLGSFLKWCLTEGHEAITSLSRTLVEDYDAHRVASGEVREVSTRRLYLGIIEKWWRWCYEHETLCAYVPRPAKIPKPPRVVKQTIAPLWSQVDAVVVLAAKKRDEEMARAESGKGLPGPIWLAMYWLALLLRGTGLRLSQCLRLRWTDFDFSLGTLRIRPELGKTPFERTGRTLPPPRWLILALLTVPEELRVGLVVSVPARGRKGVVDGTLSPIAPSTGADRMNELWQAVRVDGRPVPAEIYEGQPDHAFRKAIRTECRAVKCESDAIEYWCGRTIGTPDRYTDPRAHDLVAIAKAIPAPPYVIGTSPDIVELDAKRRRGRSRGAA